MKELTKKIIANLLLIALTIISPNTIAGGAGGSWGDDTTSGNPYTGTGGSFGGGGASGAWANCTATWKVTGQDPNSMCKDFMEGYKSRRPELQYNYELKAKNVRNFTCRITAGAYNYGGDITCQGDPCPDGSEYSLELNKCILKCPEKKVYNDTLGQCIVDPNQCLSPFTLINGICVPPKKPDPETKRCPYGYTLQDNQCVKDPPRACDPAIQNCDENGNTKCICEKLQTIIENQGVQIDLHNRTNQRLSDILAQQQTNNLKIDGLGQKLDEIARVIKDQDIRKNLLQIEKAIKDNHIDIDTVNTRLDNILQAIKDNRYDDKAMQDLVKKQTDEMIYFLKNIEKNTKTASNVVSTPMQITASVSLSEVTNRQDEQIKILKDIKDLFKNDDKKDEPLPDPATPETITNDYDPFGALKGFNISQNRINANSQCPVDKSFQIMGRTFVIPMTYLCQFLAMLAPVFLALAYFAGARIIIKG